MVFELLVHAAHAHLLTAPVVAVADHSSHTGLAGDKTVVTHKLDLVGSNNEVYDRCGLQFMCK